MFGTIVTNLPRKASADKRNVPVGIIVKSGNILHRFKGWNQRTNTVSERTLREFIDRSTRGERGRRDFREWFCQIGYNRTFAGLYNGAIAATEGV